MTPEKVTPKQSEIEKRVEELVLYSGCVSGDCPHEKWSDCAEHYQKLIKQFILEMPEVKEVVEALKAYSNAIKDQTVCVSIPYDDLDADDFDIIEEFESGEPNNFGFRARQALSKLRELGVV